MKEMTDALCLDLADKGLVTGSFTLMIGYANECNIKPATTMERNRQIGEHKSGR